MNGMYHIAMWGFMSVHSFANTCTMHDFGVMTAAGLCLENR
jgi:hypothetical protein